MYTTWRTRGISPAAARSAAGDLAELERRQFDVEAAVARLAASRAREDAASKHAELSRQVGGGTESMSLRGAMDADLGGSAPAETTTAAETPRVRRAAALARSAALQASAARWARLPLASVYAEHEWSRAVAFTASTRIGFALNLPLFSLGNETVRMAAARATAAEADAREAELEAERDLTAARTRVRETRLRASIAATRLGPESARLREGSVRLFDAGRVSVLQVLDALRAERHAQLLVLDELLAFQEARADLDALLGRTTPLSSRIP